MGRPTTPPYAPLRPTTYAPQRHPHSPCDLRFSYLHGFGYVRTLAVMVGPWGALCPPLDLQFGSCLILGSFLKYVCSMFDSFLDVRLTFNRFGAGDSSTYVRTDIHKHVYYMNTFERTWVATRIPFGKPNCTWTVISLSLTLGWGMAVSRGAWFSRGRADAHTCAHTYARVHGRMAVSRGAYGRMAVSRGAYVRTYVYPSPQTHPERPIVSATSARVPARRRRRSRQRWS